MYENYLLPEEAYRFLRANTPSDSLWATSPSKRIPEHHPSGDHRAMASHL
jgi:hypothetical protein